jgi:WD40 repeat protein
VLAAALAQAPEVRRSFADGIYWIAVGRDANTLSTMTRVGLAVGDDFIDRYAGIAEARLLLGKTLEKKNCLLVLDDVWEVEVAEALHTAVGKNVRILLTSRKRNLFASAGVHEVPINELSKEEALKLLADWTEIPRDKLPPEAIEIAKECGSLPLALSMIGATVRGRPDRWGHALERLRSADLSKIQRKLPDYKYETLDRAMLVGFEDLGQDLQRRYLDFVAVPEDVEAPGTMFRAWWAHEGMNELDAIEALDELVDRSLLRVHESSSYTLHDVQRDFLVMRTENERTLHARWLAAFAARTPYGWAAADEDGYLFNHLGHHLRGAEREDEWRQLLVSFQWLDRKTRICGFPAVLRDLAAYSDDSRIGPLHRGLRRAAHVLANDPSQLAAQLLARMDETPELDQLLKGARAWRYTPWLRPVTPSLGEQGEPTLVVFRGREEDGHAGTSRTIALSQDGSLIASGGGSANDLTLKVWSARVGALLRTYVGGAALAFISLKGHLERAHGDAVMNLGVLCLGSGELRLYALDAGEPIARRTFDNESGFRISVSERDGIVFIGFDDGRVLAWNPATDNMVVLREPEGDAVVALAYAPAARRVAIATASVIECRNAQGGQLIGQLEQELRGGFQFSAPPLVITTNGSRVFFGDPPRVWTIGERAAKALIENVDIGRLVDLTDDGAVALIALDDRELAAIEVPTGRRICRIRNSREFSCVALARGGRVVATGDYEHDVKLWDLTRAETQPSPWERRGPVRSVAICDDRGLAFVATENGHELWDTLTGAPLEVEGQVACDRVIRRSESLAEPRMERELRARLEETLRVTQGDMTDIPGLLARVGVLAFSRTAGRAISSPRYGGKPADKEEEPYDSATGGRYTSLQLWDFNNIREPRLLLGHTRSIRCADMTKNGKFAVTGSSGRLLRLWDLDTGVCLHILRGHRGIVFGCALTDDARLAVSGSEDMTVRLWDLAQGKLLFTFAVSSAVMSCDIARVGSAAIAAEVSGRLHTFSIDGLTPP